MSSASAARSRLPPRAPLYPTTESVRQATLRSAIDQALKLLDITPVPELLLPELSGGLMSLADALQMLHRPAPEISLDDLALGRHPAQRRLILEELLAHNLSILAVRAGVQKDRALPLRADNLLSRRFLAALSFSPTATQRRVVAEITQDLARDVPITRLVQGDVGSGKMRLAALAGTVRH